VVGNLLQPWYLDAARPTAVADALVSVRARTHGREHEMRFIREIVFGQRHYEITTDPQQLPAGTT
jgi:hypothetical protein